MGVKTSQIPADYYDNNMLFCVKDKEYVGLNLNNKSSNRTANVIIVGGSGKAYKCVSRCTDIAEKRNALESEGDSNGEKERPE